MFEVNARIQDIKQLEVIIKPFAQYIQGGLITLQGDLGVGKTSFVRGLLRELGWQAAVKSPTFSLMEYYTLGRLRIYHFDLYRLMDETELEYVGFREILLPEHLVFVEWPQRVPSLLERADIQLHWKYDGDDRMLSIRGRDKAFFEDLNRRVRATE